MRRISPVAVLAIISMSAANAFAATAVTVCGQTVRDGYLPADLDCTNACYFAVVVEDGGSLDLAGHTLTGTGAPSLDYSGGIRCVGDCSVSNGTITGPAEPPSTGFGSHGIFADDMRGSHTITVSNLNVTSWTGTNYNGTGIRGRNIVISDSNLTGNVVGVSAYKSATVDNSVFDGNYLGVYAGRKAIVRDSSVTNSGNAGISVPVKATLSNTQVLASQWVGFLGGRLIATSSTLEDNCHGTWPGCADIVAPTLQRPKLDSTSTCGTSLIKDENQSFGVCAAD